MDVNGNFVVTWTAGDEDGTGIYAQRFQSDGTQTGGEFQVNTITRGDQFAPKIAVAANGNFTITWGSDAENPTARGNSALVSIGNDDLAFFQGVKPGQLSVDLIEIK